MDKKNRRMVSFCFLLFIFIFLILSLLLFPYYYYDSFTIYIPAQHGQNGALVSGALPDGTGALSADSLSAGADRLRRL